jgi:hypothetical protein
MKYKVTAEHIAKGERECGSSCPVALAIQEAERDMPRLGICVDEYEIECGVDRYKTPEAVRAFVKAYDTEQPVEPFEFELTDKDLMPPHPFSDHEDGEL